MVHKVRSAQHHKRHRHAVRTPVRLRPLSLAIRVALASGLGFAVLPNARAALPDPAAAWVQQVGNSNVYQLGSTTATFGARDLLIEQREAKVVLDWDTFHIDAGNAVRFQQPDSAALAINRIAATDGLPSRIFGQLSANGQVYLLNSNGILFGNGAQVNVRSLLASSLEMSQRAIDNGVLEPTRIDNLPAFEGDSGFVRVEQGALLRAEGGRILIFAPEVSNEGLIQTPDGQTVLAAGQRIYISSVEANDATNPELAGQLLVEVDVGGVSPEALQAFLRGESTSLPVGTATNRGVIEAARGNISMLGLAVNQQGRVSATTSVQVGGSVRLVAQAGSRSGAARGGRVQLDEGSLTEVQLELDSEAAQPAAVTQPDSSIKVAGHNVFVERDAAVLAPSGTIELHANAEGATRFDLDRTARNDSRIFVADTARIDVSGAELELSVSRNYLDVELRGAQLQDSPYQRDGSLRGQKVRVDIRNTGVRADGSEWVGTPIADLRGDVDAIQRTVGERSLDAGAVKITSQGDVLLQAGASIDVSGGRIDYRADLVGTSKLVSGGRVYDIAEAPPELHYDQVIDTFTKTYARWGRRYTWDIFPAQLEPGYVQGFDAGRLQLIASRAALEADLLGGVWVGPYQRSAPPRGGELIIGQLGGTGPSPDRRTGDVLFSSQRRLTSLLEQGFDPRHDALPDAFDTLYLSPDLFGPRALHRATVYSNGLIRLAQDTALRLPAGGRLALHGQRVEVQGEIRIPAGTVDLQASQGFMGDAQIGIELGPDSVIDTRGLWSNDSLLSGTVAASLDAIWRSGGTVRLTTQDGQGITTAGRIDVSGGAWLDLAGRLHAGDAGRIEIATERVGSGETNTPWLRLNGQLLGYALGAGGSLALTADTICIGGAACADPASLRLDPALFQQGGFRDFSLTANRGGLRVAEQAVIRPLAESWLLDTGFATRPSGTDMALFTRRVVLPEQLRTPATMSLNNDYLSEGMTAAAFARAGILELSNGARIEMDPGSRVELSSNTRMLIGGRIDAPAGDIRLELSNDLTLATYLDGQSIWLSDSAYLNVAGQNQVELDRNGRRIGQVLNGGRIELAAQRGYLFSASGSRLDASGTAALLDIPLGSRGFQRRLIASDAGSIVLSAAEGMYLAGQFQAQGGGVGAAGGLLSVQIDGSTRNNPANLNFPTSARTLRLTAETPTALPADMVSGQGPQQFGLTNGEARLSVAQIHAGGFDRLNLDARNLVNSNNVLDATGRVLLEGSLALQLKRDIVIDSPALQVQDQATLSAAYIALGYNEREATYQGTPQPQAGDGQLSLTADLIDLIGHVRIQNAAEVALHSRGDIRLRGVQVGQGLQVTGSLLTLADLRLQADQIYPTSLSEYRLEVSAAEGTLRILQDSGTPAPVLSAAGRLQLRADNIEQQGTLKAPLGELDVQAGTQLVLGRGSLTSTSAAGQTIPFGRLEAGRDWVYALYDPVNAASVYRVFAGTDAEPLPQKRIRLDAPAIEVREQSVVDVSGGGDLLAYEFVPGVQGTRDLLDPVIRPNAFAVLPGSGLQYAPYDSQEAANSNLQPGATISLSAAAGLPAGTYAVLPARYALLPGAYLIEAVDGFNDLPAGQSAHLPGGVPVVAGYRGVAGTDIRSARSSGFSVRRGDSLAQFARYDTALANDFFSNRAAREERAVPRLPADAGSLSLAPTQSLSLQGRLLSAAANGARGSAVDIAAEQLAISAGPAAAADGFVQLSAEQLNAFGAESLLLGALRSRGTEHTLLEVRARQVQIGADVALEVPDLLIAARERIEVASGATLAASGSARTGDAELRAEGDGALLRLSSDRQVQVDRGDLASGAQGDLIIGSGAHLSAQGSAVLDATRDTRSEGELNMQGGSLNLGALRISLGQAEGVSQGLVLGNTDLAQAQVDELVLTSRSGLDIYGAVDLQVNDLEIQAAGISGYANSAQQAQLHARGSISLRNPEGVQDHPLNLGDGRLALTAQQDIVLADGGFQIQGFQQVDLTAGREIRGAGQAELTVNGALNLNAPRLTAQQGADVTIQAADVSDPLLPTYHALRITAPSTLGTELPLADLGARMNLIAARIEHGGRIDLNAGVLNMEARGSAPDAGIQMLEGARVDVSGRALNFDGVAVPAAAGRFSVSTAHGDVRLDGTLDLSAAPGGAAGRFEVQAAAGAFVLGGRVLAQADDAEQGGRVQIDAAELGDFSALNAQLNIAGFSAERRLRQRQGDLQIAQTDRLTAQRIAITADAGDLIVAGELNATGVDGGRIELNAGQDLTLTPSARLLAAATQADGDGGRIDLRSQAGGVQTRGATLDVSAGVSGEAGEITVRAPRAALLSVLDSDPSNDALSLDANIQGAARKRLEAFALYNEDDGVIDAQDSAPDSFTTSWYNDAQAFVSAATGATAAAGDAGFVLQPGIEIQSSGDLTLSADWNLRDWRFAEQAGVLTLRAGGSLNIGAASALDGSTPGALSDGFETSQSATLLDGPSWSYRLVAGAELQSADPLAVQRIAPALSAGDVRIANGTPGRPGSFFLPGTPPLNRVVRTGSGEIDIATAGDLVLANAQAVIYTAGVPSGGIALSGLGNRVYPDGGGDLRIKAGRDVKGFEGNQLVNNWLFRAGRVGDGSFFSPSSASGWTVAFDQFQQNIGALGGGQVEVTAGRHIDNLSVSIPSIGKLVSGSTPADSQIELLGGGDLMLRAGGDIAGGVFYVGLGEGQLWADGGIVSRDTLLDAEHPGSLHSVLALGEGRFELYARQDLNLETVFNPTLLPQVSDNATAVSFYSTYADSSQVRLTSVAGDVLLHHDFEALSAGATLRIDDLYRPFLSLYPPTLSARALGGDIQLQGSDNANLWLYPAPKGNLELLATDSISFDSNLKFVLSDLGPEQLPTPNNPFNSLIGDDSTVVDFGENRHAAVPVHSLVKQPDALPDSTPARLVTLTGDIIIPLDTNQGVYRFRSAKPVRISAGRDIVDPSLELQHTSSEDVSLLSAGRDLVFSSPRVAETGGLSVNSRSVRIMGPGRLDVVSGRDVELGTSTGFETTGNQLHPALAEDGAAIVMLAGVAAGVDSIGFIENYPRYFTAESFNDAFIAAVASVAAGLPADLATAQAVYRGLDEREQAAVMTALDLPVRYAASFLSDAQGAGYFDTVSTFPVRVATQVRTMTGQTGLSDAEAIAQFPTLSETARRKLVLEAFFTELQWSGRVAARSGSNAYPLGFAAIDTLFSGSDYRGDINMVLSRITTLDGGDIQLLAPGGHINVGLSTPPASFGAGKPAGELGIVVQKQGDIRVFADADVQVEESRIFAVDGGDILAWSSNGDIDAGRGAKSALSVAPPTVTFTEDGVVQVELSQAFAGSGIRAFATSDEQQPGDVDLFAPRGVVNAGDAGIGGGNVTVAATAILGADNIDVGGLSVGVTLADTSSLAAGLTGLSNLSSSVSKLAEESVNNLGADQDSFEGDGGLGLLSVELLGFGE